MMLPSVSLSVAAQHVAGPASTTTIDASAGFNGTNEAHDQGRVVVLALHRFDILAFQVADTLRNPRNGMKLVVKAKLVQLKFNEFLTLRLHLESSPWGCASRRGRKSASTVFWTLAGVRSGFA